MGLQLGGSAGKREIEHRIDEQLSSLITQVTNEINWYLREGKLTRADLAGRMGVSPGRVSQILSGGENLTLRTLAGLATALDAQFDVTLSPREATLDDDVSEDIARADDAAAGDILEEISVSAARARR
jgi:transcriptional regulator with XRE-family HTH domain